MMRTFGKRWIDICFVHDFCIRHLAHLWKKQKSGKGRRRRSVP